MFVLFTFLFSVVAGHNKCVIGVLGLPAYFSTGGDHRPELLDSVADKVFVSASYVKYLEQWGCRVALISYKLDKD